MRGVHEQRGRDEHRGRRRLVAELAVRGHDGPPRMTPAEPPVRREGEVLVCLLLDKLVRSPRLAGQARRDRVLGRGERVVAGRLLGEVEANVREDLDGRVEQYRTAYTLGFSRVELEDEPGSEAVPQPDGRPLDTGRIHRLEDVSQVGRDAPRRLIARAAVTSEVGC
jgi:hypothetical protein